jgi:dipeptidyl aminopeptidase/acylaminoacyl peptidase
VVPVENALAFEAAYEPAAVECEAHFYPTGGHGFGLGRAGSEVADWTNQLAAWLHARGLITAKSYEKLSHR